MRAGYNNIGDNLSDEHTCRSVKVVRISLVTMDLFWDEEEKFLMASAKYEIYYSELLDANVQRTEIQELTAYGIMGKLGALQQTSQPTRNMLSR